MSTNGKETISYGLMPHFPENWDKLREFFRGEPAFIPDPELGVASVATLPTGEVVGGLILQMVSYMGPFKVHPLYAGAVDYVKLKRLIDEKFKNGRGSNLIINGYIVLTADERIAKMAEIAGMERKPECITLVQTFDGAPIVLR